jgi:hypothetical protein
MFSLLTKSAMNEVFLRLKNYLNNLSAKGQQYTNKLKESTSNGQLNQSNIDIISKHKALPLIINNYMLRLFTNYREEAQAEYQATLTVLNSSVTYQRGALNQQLYEISINIRLIDKAIIQYQSEKNSLEKDIRISMGLTITTSQQLQRLRNDRLYLK